MSVILHPSYSKRLNQLTDAIKYENGYAEVVRRLKELTDSGGLDMYLYRLQTAVRAEFAGQIYDRNKTQWNKDVREDKLIQEALSRLSRSSVEPSRPEDPHE